MKPLGAALGRLAGTLGAVARRELQAAMLADLLGTCAASPGLEAVLVVTVDPDVAAIARASGAQVVADHDPPRGMNPAVARGLAVAAGTAEAALVLTADLPLAAPADIAAVLAAAPPAPSAVLVPSRDGSGTNAMLLRPPGALVPELGLGSLARHLAQAARRGLEVARCERPGLALDIDTPADLALLRAADVRLAERAAPARAL